LVAARTNSFPFSQITSVDLRVALLGGHLKIGVAGTLEKGDFIAKPWHGPMQAENELSFGPHLKEQMKRITALIREKVHQATQGPAPQTAPYTLSEQLVELAGLRRDGALTEEEFTQAKARLLQG